MNKTLLGCTLAATSCHASTLQQDPTGADRNPTDRPNVVLIYLDDAGYADISANGGKYKTENIDKIAVEAFPAGSL